MARGGFAVARSVVLLLIVLVAFSNVWVFRGPVPVPSAQDGFHATIPQRQQASSSSASALSGREQRQQSDKGSRLDPTASLDVDNITLAAATTSALHRDGWHPVAASEILGDDAQKGHKVAGLSCQAYGGPSEQDAAEMVYWRDIPSDATYVSPFYSNNSSAVQYLTFEPDIGGFNNIRMSMETAVALALAMGRTLVLPPEQPLYLLEASAQKKKLGFADFYHLESIRDEHASSSLKIISFEDFLRREALTGHLRDKDSGQVSFPPGNRTDWSQVLGFNWQSAIEGEGSKLWGWFRRVTKTLSWSDSECIAVFPSSPHHDNSTLAPLLKALEEMATERHLENGKFNYEVLLGVVKAYKGNPTPVNASALDRLREMLADRKRACVYSAEWQQAPVIHIWGDEPQSGNGHSGGEGGYRLLIHFYAFLFFENWKQDLWTKRFIRDHLRYIDEIQCAAARIVTQLRNISRTNGNADGTFDSFHIRRGDFQFSHTRLSAKEIYHNNTRRWIDEKSMVYVATDEQNKTFFDPLKEHYSLYFLDEFENLLQGVDPNYYGMIDQLVASRGEIFCGIYLSTFTGYINRIRGYHSQKLGARDGIINSYNIQPDEKIEYRRIFRRYRSVIQPFWAREFPVAWRDIDHDVPADFMD